MTTLREAAQMALDALEHGLPIIEDFGGKEQLQIQHKAIAVLYEALRAALATEQEPVAWMHIQGNHEDPCFRELTEDEISRGWTQKPLYTAPPQRKEWVGLTDEERQECLYSDPIFGMAASTFARAIEAKLKEKNGL